MELRNRDRDYLAYLRDGGTGADYARQHGFSRHWAKWKSRSLRERLGVATLEEAIQLMDDDEAGVSRADFDRLTQLVDGLGDAVEALTRAAPEDRNGARHEVQQRQLSLKDHAKALGLSLADVEKLQEERDYGRFKKWTDRLAAEKAAALEAEGDDDDEDDDDGDDGVGRRILDGLGGIRNVNR